MNYHFHKMFALAIGAFVITFLMFGKFSMADEYKISSFSNNLIAAESHEKDRVEGVVCGEGAHKEGARKGERGEARPNAQAPKEEHPNYLRQRLEPKKIQFRTPQINAQHANALHAKALEEKKC